MGEELEKYTGIRHVQYSYDSFGNMLRIDTDEGADGSIDSQRLFRYEDGVLVAQDEFEDGVLIHSQS